MEEKKDYRAELFYEPKNGYDTLSDAGREALEKLPGIGSWQLPRPGRKSRDDEPREVRKAEARDLRHEPPLPEE